MKHRLTNSRLRYTRKPSKGIAASIADQAVSSLGNFVLLIAVARSVSASDFGLFTIVLTLYALAIGLSQALVSEFVLFDFAPGQRRPNQDASAVMAGGLIGVLLLPPLALIGLFSPLGFSVLLLGLALPMLLCQDVLRHIWLSTGQATSALWNDLIWSVGAIGTIAFANGQMSSTQATTIWLAWGAFASVLGVVRSRTWTRHPSIIKLHFKRSRRYIPGLLGDYLVANGLSNLTNLAISGVLGLSATGGFRAAQSIFNPLNTVFSASRMIAIPRMAQNPRLAHRVACGVSFSFLCVSLLYYIAVIVMPDSVGRALFGSSWSLAIPLVGICGLSRLLGAVVTGPSLALRALREVRRGFVARLVTAISLCGLGILGALVNVEYAMWGINVAGLVSVVAYVGMYVRARSTSPARDARYSRERS